MRNGDETDADCGGTSCKACIGAACAEHVDCASKVCTGSACAPPGTKYCGVGVPSQPACENADPCSTRDDCASDYCTVDHVCAQPGSDVHSDGVSNAGETGIDCGGTVASTMPCKSGEICGTDMDCQGLCDGAMRTCKVPTHGDGKLNPSIGESDIDCGGSTTDVDGRVPVACVPEKMCNADGDCTGTCGRATARTCDVETHGDGKKNAGETDADCGGTTIVEGALAPRCLAAAACTTSDDCTGTCGQAAAGKCDAETHADNKQNAGEADIDCGGTAMVAGALAAPCVAGQKCTDGAIDCDSRFCGVANIGLCDPRRTGVKDGDETDVDCGGDAVRGERLVGANGRWNGNYGPPAGRCTAIGNQACLANTDCGSGYCGTGSKRCVSGRSCTAAIGGAPTAGIDTCGKETVVDQESCCRSLSLSSGRKRLDKYEVTGGRIRQFVEWLKDAPDPTGAAYNYNMRKWAADQMAGNTSAGKVLASQIPVSARDMLPSTYDVKTPLNMFVQLGATSMDPSFPVPVQGCYTGASPTTCKTRAIPGNNASACVEWNYVWNDTYGHATYWQDQTYAEAFYFPGHPARAFPKEEMDQKSMNCAPYWVYAAFCAWDGGRLPKRAEKLIAYPSTYPWATQSWASSPGAGYPVNPSSADAHADWRRTANLQNSHYYFFFDNNRPALSYDTTTFIAPPGRFFLDKSSVQGDGESWMDLGGNMIEIHADLTGSANFCDASVLGAGETYNCTTNGKSGVLRATGVPRAVWRGGSWEDHGIGSDWGAGFPLQTQYGKMGVRCLRCDEGYLPKDDGSCCAIGTASCP